jgi:hypothetical protein
MNEGTRVTFGGREWVCGRFERSYGVKRGVQRRLEYIGCD